MASGDFLFCLQAGVAAVATAAGAGGIAATTVIVHQEDEDDDKEDPGAVAAKEILQTHNRFPPFLLSLSFYATAEKV